MRPDQSNTDNECGYLVMANHLYLFIHSSWIECLAEQIIIMSIPNTNKLEVAVACEQREADHGYITGDLSANIKRFVWKLLILCLALMRIGTFILHSSQT